MKLLFAFSILLFSGSAFAQQACFENEKNVITKKMFTEEEWNIALKEWDAQEPKDPGILKLFFAWNVYNKELPTANKFKGDKRKHCYMGCRIAQDVSYETAVYVAWYKEKEDLTDCKVNSNFEHRDYEITIEGADLAHQGKGASYCFDECGKIKRY